MGAIDPNGEQFLIYSKILNTLEKQGLLRRERSSEDKRGFFATTTDLGSVEVRKAWIIYKKGIHVYFEKALTTQEVQQLLVNLPKLRKIFQYKDSAPVTHRHYCGLYFAIS